MAVEVVVALIGLGGSALGSVLGIFINTKLINYRIEQLEKKVNKHNNLIDRTYNLETQERLLEEQMKVANHRISDLEEEQRTYQDNKFMKEL